MRASATPNLSSRPTGGERALIQQIRSWASVGSGGLRVGIGDDCAVLKPPPDGEVVVTTDFSLEGRHFRRELHPSRSIGHRCLARGLSDLAAMGATPVAAFLSLALPAGFAASTAGKRWISGFFDGLLALGKSTKTPLAGGDTATAPGNEILADIVLLGTVPAEQALLRSGAKPGDSIYVTGSLGASAAEFELLATAPRRFSRSVADGTHPHLFPAPRLAAGQALLKRQLASAAIDLSDGLSVDLRHLCEQSRVDAVIESDALPLGGTLNQALHGGEDYELLFTSSAAMPRRLGGAPITRIGSMLRRPRGASPSIWLQQQSGRIALEPQGWEHTL